jgi:hypothetical protein
MIESKPGDLVRPPANAVAQLVLQCTRDDPTLIKRSRGHARTVQIQGKRLPVTRPEPGSPLMLLSNADPATRQYLEDLVSIAVASSERADDVLREAYEARQQAKRATWAFASIAAIGVMAGVAGVIGKYHGYAVDNRLSEIVGEVRSLGEQQQQASQQLAAVRSDIAEVHQAAAAPQPTAEARPENTQGATVVETRPATAAQPSQPVVATAVSPLQSATYSSPWPVYPQPVRPTWYHQQRRATVPHFLIVFQQNLHALFR